MKEKGEYKTVQYSDIAHELAQRIANHAELRRKSSMEVDFIIKFHPNDGEIMSVIRKCKLPCQCEECAFREICDNIKNQIISTNKEKIGGDMDDYDIRDKSLG